MPPPHAPGTPLSVSEMQLIQQATTARHYIRSAARVAFMSAASMLAIAVISLVLSLLSFNVFDIVVSLALLTVGYFEYRGSNLMKRADSSAPWYLCRNQLIFIAMVAILCPIFVYRLIPEVDEAFATNPELNEVLNQSPDIRSDIHGMQTQIHQTSVHYAPYVIGGAIAVVAFSQGGLALYYLTRKRRVREYQEATPEWVRNVLNTTLS